MTYLLTFSCYGCHLHGSESGSVDRRHHVPGTPTLESDPARETSERERMAQAPYNLDQVRRDTVLEAIQEVCAHRGWDLLAAHERTTHVHAVVEAEAPPYEIMDDFKVYASRRLNRMGLDGAGRKRWTRRGSTRRLWKPERVSAAIQYVVAAQGDAMSVFEATAPSRSRL